MCSWSDGLTKKLLATRCAAAARKQRVSALSERLRCASGDEGPLAAALKRSRDLRLCYLDMMWSLRHNHGLLTTRRNSLVISLFHHFRLQPMVCAVLLGSCLCAVDVLARLWGEILLAGSMNHGAASSGI